MINMVYIVLIDFWINVFMWFRLSTYFIILLKDNLIHFMINNKIVLLIYVNSFLVLGSYPRSLVGLLL